MTFLKIKFLLIHYNRLSYPAAIIFIANRLWHYNMGSFPYRTAMNIFLCLTHNSGIKEKVKCNLSKGRSWNTYYWQGEWIKLIYIMSIVFLTFRPYKFLNFNTKRILSFIMFFILINCSGKEVLSNTKLLIWSFTFSYVFIFFVFVWWHTILGSHWDSL